MKKIFILAILMAVATGIASAQMWVGGYMIISDNDATQNGHDHTSSSFSFHPTVGYDLNEKLSLGVTLGYNHNSNYVEANNYSNNYHSNIFSISPFLRYHYMEWGKLRAFVDGGVTYMNNNICNLDNDSQTIGLFLDPGFAYEINDRFAIETTFGAFNFMHNWTDEDNYSNQLNLSLTSSISLGFIIKL